MSCLNNSHAGIWDHEKSLYSSPYPISVLAQPLYFPSHFTIGGASWTFGLKHGNGEL